MLAQGRELLAMGCGAVLMKGGHLDDEQSPDWLFTREGEQRFTAPRIMTKNTHGTGCTLSAALAALRRAIQTGLTPYRRQKAGFSVGVSPSRHAGSGSRYWFGSPLPRLVVSTDDSCFGYCEPLALTLGDETNAAKTYQSKKLTSSLMRFLANFHQVAILSASDGWISFLFDSSSDNRLHPFLRLSPG